ncbi:MAG: hypothetical protein ACYCZ0_00025 [Minisyncoccota bacterium]
MNTDFETLSDGERVMLYPLADNPLHKHPVMATFQNGYFYCDGTPPEDGPDYYYGDVLRYCEGFSRGRPVPKHGSGP